MEHYIQLISMSIFFITIAYLYLVRPIINSRQYKIEKERKNFIAQLTLCKSKYEEKLTQCKANYENQLAQCKANYENQLAQCKANYEMQLMQYKVEHENHLIQCKIDCNDQLAQCKANHENQLTQYKEMYEKKIKDIKQDLSSVKNELNEYHSNVENLLKSNLSSIPWLAGMMSDFLTWQQEKMAISLDWGKDIQRAKKVKSIRDIRAESMIMIEALKEEAYQLRYLLQIYPDLEDLINTDYKEIQLELPKLGADSHNQQTSNEEEIDPVYNYLTKEEWLSLPTTKRNQMALDNYVSSRKKSKWQIGRDYEMSVAYQLYKKDFDVDPTGIKNKLEDLGRDIIAKKGNKTFIIQCKYWSEKKEIHEKHVFQLYGSTIMYCLENNLNLDSVTAIIYTNITCSEMAKKAAKFLKIELKENYPLIEFPRIKCNINIKDGKPTKIYHLPMDRLYDVTKIDKKGEFYAFTVEEAEKRGFRRTYKWHGN